LSYVVLIHIRFPMLPIFELRGGLDMPRFLKRVPFSNSARLISSHAMLITYVA
jgi:hypothetical protein